MHATCSTEWMNRILIQIFEIHFHSSLPICLQVFVVLFWEFLHKCNIAHFCGFGKVTERFLDLKVGLLKIFFEEGKL